MIDIDRVRAETPSCADVLHFNNAGSSLMPLPVFEAVSNALKLEYSVGGYEAERLLGDELRAFYDEFAQLLNAEPEEIAFVENATRAWDMAFYGLPLKAGDRVVTHASEYASNYLALLQQARRRGIVIDVVPSDAHGQIDLAALEAAITPQTKLIALTHVPTQGGLVNPAIEVGRIARRHNITYLLDACQSVGQMVVDVKAIGCDILSGTGRKFLRGPRGTGFLYVRKEIAETIDPPFIDLLSATWTQPQSYELAGGARRFENFESYVAGRVGLTAAVRYARGVGIPAIEQRVSSLADTLRGELAAIDGVGVHDLGQVKCGIVTFQKSSMQAKEIAERLRGQNINVSVSILPYAQLDLGQRGLASLVRASVHYFNTDDEIERFVAAIRAV
ncbi:aminotransferase [Mesorhizobium loti]|nr:aminotransferase class V-fold PLP-dependent enzyme [Mesorhizobium loti]PLP56268.1 aminotransferase [Mesorhizobium loti]